MPNDTLVNDSGYLLETHYPISLNTNGPKMLISPLIYYINILNLKPSLLSSYQKGKLLKFTKTLSSSTKYPNHHRSWSKPKKNPQKTFPLPPKLLDT